MIIHFVSLIYALFTNTGFLQNVHALVPDKNKGYHLNWYRKPLTYPSNKTKTLHCINVFYLFINVIGSKTSISPNIAVNRLYMSTHTFKTHSTYHLCDY